MTLPEPITLNRGILTDQVYELLKERIIDQVYAPNARLRVEEIAASLGVSATPVREALNRLSSERLVVVYPQRGFVVATELDQERYRELFDVCTWLQAKAAELGAATANDVELAELTRAVTGMDAASRVRGYEGFRAFNTYDRIFHGLIMRLSRNSYLAELWELLNPHAQLARLYNRAFATGAIVATYSSEEHKMILEAYRAHDAVRARDLLTDHMQKAKHRWLQFAVSVEQSANQKGQVPFDR